MKACEYTWARGSERRERGEGGLTAVKRNDECLDGDEEADDFPGVQGIARVEEVICVVYVPA